MLAALANAGHGVELDTVHRFTHDWEATRIPRAAPWQPRRPHPVPGPGASARLPRHGRRRRRRARPLGHGVSSRPGGVDDGPHPRRRGGPQHRGESHRRGDRVRCTARWSGSGSGDWQAGDLLRARRNDRRLAVGDEAHVRNGDRYQRPVRRRRRAGGGAPRPRRARVPARRVRCGARRIRVGHHHHRRPGRPPSTSAWCWCGRGSTANTSTSP